MNRCLLCKAFIRRRRCVDCRRCGARNYDPTVPTVATYACTPATYAGWLVTGANAPYAYRVRIGVPG